MRVLAFDTATPATAVALRDVDLSGTSDAGREGSPGGQGLDLEVREDPAAGARPGHVSRLLALIEQVLDRAGGWDTVDRIAVGVGPGTFTGLRIGIATAQGLARARGLELVGISTLQSIALCARAGAPDPAILAVIDARRGEVFTAAWATGADPIAVPPSLEPCVLGPGRLAHVCQTLGPGVIAAGDGAVKFRGVLESAGVLVVPDDSPLHRVSAREHCRLAVAVRPASSSVVLPEYLRLPDAELTRPA